MTEPESAASQAATLELHDASFGRVGATGVAPLSLRSDARRIGLVGNWQPLFRGFTNESTLTAGSARILGSDVHVALMRGVVGFAACDPDLPASFSVFEYLEHAARLSHGSPARAKDDARRALEEYGLSELAPRALGRLVRYQSRAVAIACAAVSAPAVLCLETPLHDLDAASADYIARLCAHAAERSRLIVSTALPSTPSAERALLDACNELFVLKHGTLVAHGSPSHVFAPSPRYLLTLVGAKNGDFAAALSRVGCQVTEQASPKAFNALLAVGSRVTRYLIELPEPSSQSLLLDAALEQGVTVLELEPVFQTLAD